MAASSDRAAGAAVRPLEGLRVVDLSSVVMGPYATQVLADHGADVIKVEPPEGDVARKAGPMRAPNMGPLHHQINRNKRGIVLDLKRGSARDALLQLCRTADVFVTNIRPAAMARLRLSWEDVRQANERVIYASLVGFGEGGPYAGRPAYDDIIQGLSALPSLFVRAGGDRPRYVPATLADRVVGLAAASAILAAVVSRQRTGVGHFVEVPMFEMLAQFVLSDHMAGRTFEPAAGPTGYQRLIAPDRRPFETKDGYVCALLYTSKQWQAFFEIVGRGEEFRSDPRLHDLATRARHYDEVYRIVADVLRTETTEHWLRLLGENDIPCVRLYSVDDLIDDEHLAATRFFEQIDDPREGRLRLVGVPTRWDGARIAIERVAPRIGQHTVEVLQEAGLSRAEIDALVAEGAARVGDSGA